MTRILTFNNLPSDTCSSIQRGYRLNPARVTSFAQVERLARTTPDPAAFVDGFDMTLSTVMLYRARTPDAYLRALDEYDATVVRLYLTYGPIAVPSAVGPAYALGLYGMRWPNIYLDVEEPRIEGFTPERGETPSGQRLVTLVKALSERDLLLSETP